MKYFLPILLFVTVNLNAQTLVKATDYIKSLNIVGLDTSVIIKAGGYVDYPIQISKSGIYCFALNVLNDVGDPTTVSVKTPTGTTILGTASIPINPQYQTVCVNIKLTTASTKIRFVFADAVTLSSFTYGIPDAVTYVSQADFISLKNSFDSLKIEFNKNVIRFNPDYFRFGADSSIMPINFSPNPVTPATKH